MKLSTTKLQLPNPEMEGRDALMWRLELIYRHTGVDFKKLVSTIRDWKQKKPIDKNYWEEQAKANWPDPFDVALLLAKSLLDVRDQVSLESYNYLQRLRTIKSG